MGYCYCCNRIDCKNEKEKEPLHPSYNLDGFDEAPEYCKKKKVD